MDFFLYFLTKLDQTTNINRDKSQNNHFTNKHTMTVVSPVFHDLHHILCITLGSRLSELQPGSCLHQKQQSSIINVTRVEKLFLLLHR